MQLLLYHQKIYMRCQRYYSPAAQYFLSLTNNKHNSLQRNLKSFEAINLIQWEDIRVSFTAGWKIYWIIKYVVVVRLFKRRIYPDHPMENSVSSERILVSVGQLAFLLYFYVISWFWLEIIFSCYGKIIKSNNPGKRIVGKKSFQIISNTLKNHSLNKGINNANQRN